MRQKTSTVCPHKFGTQINLSKKKGLEITRNQKIR